MTLNDLWPLRRPDRSQRTAHRSGCFEANLAKALADLKWVFGGKFFSPPTLSEHRQAVRMVGSNSEIIE